MSSAKKNEVSCLVIKLKRSPIGSNKNIRLILKGLGLRRMQQVVQRPDTKQVQGLVDKVKHLVEVTHP
ncbi:MAG: 50S ribosomal protein L30 [Nitrospira sp.]|nr:50S ribosomal protein L30 [Nitrospira sp.]